MYYINMHIKIGDNTQKLFSGPDSVICDKLGVEPTMMDI